VHCAGSNSDGIPNPLQGGVVGETGAM